MWDACVSLIVWYNYQIELGAFMCIHGYCMMPLQTSVCLCLRKRKWFLRRGYGVSVGICGCVWLAGDFKVKSSWCGWLDFRETAWASPVSSFLMHALCISYVIHNCAGMTHNAFACLDVGVRTGVRVLVCEHSSSKFSGLCVVPPPPGGPR